MLAAFDDRLLIVKTGAMTGFMAGSLGGGRISTFPYAEITGVEYNAGMLNGSWKSSPPATKAPLTKTSGAGPTRAATRTVTIHGPCPTACRCTKRFTGSLRHTSMTYVRESPQRNRARFRSQPQFLHPQQRGSAMSCANLRSYMIKASSTMRSSQQQNKLSSHASRERT